MLEKRTTHLKVDKKIISLLSKSTYIRSFSNAIRELVSNSYDADALSVKINCDKTFKDIIIEDDGNGMTFEEFDHYCTIAGQKRELSLTRKFKRKRIGQFGIGFLSIFPFCESFEITSTVENSIDVLKAIIPASKYFDTNEDTDIQDIQINVGISTNNSLKSLHFTRIRLINPTVHLKQYFAKQKTNKRDSIIVWEPFKRFKWELQENLPISFKADSKFLDDLKYDEPIGMNVYLNSKQIFRNEIEKTVLYEDNGTIQNIKYKILVSTNFSSIKPLELRGMKVRINNVGIGDRTDFGLKRDRGFSRLHWLNGEVMLSGDIKKYLSINRDSLINEPVIEELNLELSEKLKSLAYYVESVSLAEKEIKNVLNVNKTVSDVRSKNEVIRSNIKTLENKGFKVKEASDNVKKLARENSNIISPIVINKQDKTITILNSDYYNIDKEIILNKNFEIRYSNDSTMLDLPCKIVNSNTIEINTNYPLFKSRQYGYLFEKIHLLLIVAQKDTETSKDMYKKIVRNFLNEFKDYQK